MSVKDDLIAARALIDTPEKWGQWTDDNSERPCALEALRVAENGLSFTKLRGYRALCDALPEDSRYRSYHGVGAFVGGFNDDPATTHADIMALFDRAIAAQP